MDHWKKKAAAILLVLSMAASFTGCGGKGGESSQNEGSQSGSSQIVSSQAQGSQESSSLGESSAPAEDTGIYDYSKGLDEDGYFSGVRALDYVTLPDYASIEVPEENRQASDDAVQTQLDQLFVARNETVRVKDRVVEDNDTVNIDYVGSVDGVEFAGGNTQGSGTTVTIGVTSYIDDFLEQLIGHKPGETFDVNVTFPDPYENNTDLSGKDAVFKTTVNYIEAKKYTELTDEFVQEKMKADFGWSTAKEMREAITLQIQEDSAGQYLWEKILEQSKVSETPQVVADFHTASMKNYYTTMAAQNGLSLAEYLEQAGVGTEEDLPVKNKEALENNAKQSMVLQALCEELNVKATDEDVDKLLMEVLAGESTEDIKTFYGVPYLRMVARETLVKRQLGAQVIKKG